MLDNVPWYALGTVHAGFAITSATARRYPPDVAPFAGLADNSAASVTALLSLLEPAETIYVLGDAPVSVPDLVVGKSFPALQMVASGAPPNSPPNEGEDRSIVRLTAADAPAMVELTDLAFPGYFRSRTYQMGTYYGIRLRGELVAMAGERMALPQYREVSGVCTHPAHTGKGYAALLISRLMRDHAEASLSSLLHVGSSNDRAIALYRRLGFSVRGEMFLHPISRQLRPSIGEDTERSPASTEGPSPRNNS